MHFTSTGNEDCAIDFLGHGKALLVFVKILFNSLYKLERLREGQGKSECQGTVQKCQTIKANPFSINLSYFSGTKLSLYATLI